MAFPPPPPYFELYTDSAKSDTEHADHFVFTPPEPVKNPFLKHGVWQEPTSFRQQPLVNVPILFNSSRPDAAPFERDEITSFRPDINYNVELRKLLFGLAQGYVGVFQALAGLEDEETKADPPVDPFQKVEKHLRDSEHRVVNMLHLIGMLRPHQARQGLIAMMENQIKKAQTKRNLLNSKTMESLRFISKAKGVPLSELMSNLPSASSLSTNDSDLANVDETTDAKESKLVTSQEVKVEKDEAVSLLGKKRKKAS